MSCNKITLEQVIAKHGGVIASGSHTKQYGDPHCELCILEMYAACLVEQGLLKEITDNPSVLGRPDYRAINDGPWSSREVATPHLIRLHMAYDGWEFLSPERKLQIMQYVVIQTVHRIIAELPGLPDDIRTQCRTAASLDDAADAADAAYGADAADATDAANAAAHAAAATMAGDAADVATMAGDAAYAAATAAAAAACADAILITATDIWVEAAKLP